MADDRGSCLSDELLAAYSLGKLSETALRGVADHLDRCSSCMTRTEALDALTDRVISGLRQARRRDTDPEGAPRGDADPGSIPIGEVLGEYEVLEVLGAGGMGRVYRAKHRRMNRIVALKVVSGRAGSLAEAHRRFQREVEAAGRLQHPHIAMAFDAGEHQGAPYLVMEHLTGSDLSRHLKAHGPLPAAKAAAYVLQAARGLHCAHEHGLIHRDVKPANLFLTAAGEIKVLDLGLSRWHGREEAATLGETTAVVSGDLTQANSFMGTLDYVAPEQIRNPHDVDPRADIYSLGCTLYALIAGRSPFVRDSAAQTLQAHQSGAFARLSQGRPKIPPRLEAICARMLQLRPDDRYPSMAELIRDLEHFLAPSRSSRLRRTVVALGVAAVLIGAAAWLAPRFFPKDPPASLEGSFSDAQAQKAQQEWAEFLNVPVKTTNALGVSLTLIPPGKRTVSEQPKEYQQPTVYALDRPCYFGTFEITVGEFRRFVVATGFKTETQRPDESAAFGMVPNSKADKPVFLKVDNAAWSNPGFAQTDDKQPVVQVTWNDATAFCQWLSEKEKATYRLPWRREFFWAMKAGADTKYFFGGDDRDLIKYAWFGDNSYWRTHPVGQLLPNAWGLHDVLGNVREWGLDWGAPGKGYKFAGLGSYFEPAAGVVTDLSYFMDRPFATIGFRVVREIPEWSPGDRAP